MRTVHFPPLDCPVSAFGFGCASLGSRIDRRQGMAALEAAFNAGVRWFDVAPSYGDGQAENLLAGFLVNKRDALLLCTKVGILSGRTSPLLRLAKPIARHVIGLVPGIRRHIAAARPPARRLPLTGALIETSLVESLRRLGTDHVDVLALHEPQPDDLRRDDVLAALEAAVAKGYARTIGVAGDPAAGWSASGSPATSTSFKWPTAPWPPTMPSARSAIAAHRPIGFVTHSVYAPHADFMMRLRRDSALQTRLTQAGYTGDPATIARTFLLDYALASNPEGVVLLSMFKTQHAAAILPDCKKAPPPKQSSASKNIYKKMFRKINKGLSPSFRLSAISFPRTAIPGGGGDGSGLC